MAGWGGSTGVLAWGTSWKEMTVLVGEVHGTHPTTMVLLPAADSTDDGTRPAQTCLLAKLYMVKLDLPDKAAALLEAKLASQVW